MGQNKLNNKGYMLVEIILASALTFALAYFLIDLTINLKNKNDDLLVKTLVSTDQAIITNIIMDKLEKDSENFKCSDIKIEGNVFKFNNKTNIVSEYAVVKYDAENKDYCYVDSNNKAITISIPITVEQLPDIDFSVNINYTKSYLSANCPVSDKKANVPVLDSGMIPVTISNDGTVTTISENDDSWYNYDNKIWANAILVKESGIKTRSYYKNNIGVKVNKDDILAYFVWIPRYSYAFTDGTGAREICIQFEEGVGDKKSGDAIKASYYTHPAFTFGSDELSGIWVGKFETSVDSTSSCYSAITGSAHSVSGATSACNNANQNPRILPDVSALYFQNVSNQFQTALKFAGGTLSSGKVSFAGSNTYGLTSAVDSHMMKNSEWGAVAYLSYSRYGINREILVNEYCKYLLSASINVCFGTKTGCGSDGVYDTKYTDCENSYGSVTTYSQSTTGNISGVFDMSGGITEYVMGVLSDADGNPRSGRDTGDEGNSGFNGKLENDILKKDGVQFPNESKYYDLYSGNIFVMSGERNTNVELCTLETCGGHALNETSGWNGDNANFIWSVSPWFRRGGFYYSGESAGIFHYMYDNGDEGKKYVAGGFRTVLTVE